MDIFAGGQVAIFFAVLLLTVKPVGSFMDCGTETNAAS